MPDRIGKFQILRLLGQGAMGEVYLAKDPAIGREIALKVIRPALAGLDPGGELRARFEREAKAAGTLSHPHVVTVFEFGEDQGLLYLAMEYVPGEDLSALLSEKALSPDEILEVVAQICDGLHHAHKHGILHRDIKPTNVMVIREEGDLRAKLMDFGVAKSTEGAATQTGQVVGTLAYMAPEYLRTGTASPATDLFAMGVMLHEALAGERPFGGATTGAVVYGIMNDPPKKLAPIHFGSMSPALSDLISNLLEKDPDQRRPANASDLAKWLRSAKAPGWRLPDDMNATTALPRSVTSGMGSGLSAAAASATTAKAKAAIVHHGWRYTLMIAIPAILIGGSLAAYLIHRSAASRIVPPTSSNMHVNDVVLDEAAQIALKGHPEEALKLTQAVIDATPKNVPVDPDAYAVKLFCLYQKGWVVAFGETLTEARFRGAGAKDLLTNSTYKDMLEKDRVKKKLPEKLRERLLRGEERQSDADPSSAS